VGPNSNLLNEDSQPDDPRRYYQTAFDFGMSTQNETVAKTTVATGAKAKKGVRKSQDSKRDKIAKTIEEFVKLLAIRVEWLDRTNKLTDSALNRFCDQQMDDLVDEFERILVINVGNIAKNFEYFTSSLNSFSYGTETWAMAVVYTLKNIYTLNYNIFVIKLIILTSTMSNNRKTGMTTSQSQTSLTYDIKKTQYWSNYVF
jgi:hypothetical protein